MPAASSSSVPTPAVPVSARHDYLDALRGWAILGVVATHGAYSTGKAFPGAGVAFDGRYGVQLFFMVSAFTIFLTLDRAREHGAPDWRAFFIRRFFRVLPMFWVGIVLYMFAPGRDPVCARLHYSPLDYALTALLQHGWEPRLINSIVPGGWSIAAEGAFYLVVPLCYRFVRGWQAAVWLLLGTLVFSEIGNRLFAAAFDGHLVGTDLNVDEAVGYISAWFPTQLPVFACGILTYFLARAADSARPAGASASTGAVLLAVAGTLMYTAYDFGKHGWLLEHVCYALAFVPLMLGLKLCPLRLLVNPATRFLGRISYSVYLLHFVVLQLALNSLNTFLPEPWQQSLPAFLILCTATLAGSSALAWLTFRWVEQPFVDLGHRLARRLANARRGEGGMSLERAEWPATSAKV